MLEFHLYKVMDKQKHSTFIFLAENAYTALLPLLLRTLFPKIA